MGRRLQIAMDQAAVLPGRLGGERVRFFRDATSGPAWQEHMDIPAPALPPMHLGIPTEVTVTTVVGPMRVGVLVARDQGGQGPVVITHHGNNEHAFDLRGRAKNYLNRALLSEPTPPDATVIVIRAAYHDGPLREYTRLAGDLARWMAMLAASTATIDSLVTRHGIESARPTLVTGFSLGGWAANLHRAFHGTAGLYLPMLAGAHLGSQLFESSYRVMVSRAARADADRVGPLLDFGREFRAATAPVAPLLARYDRFARPEDQLDDYADMPVEFLETGHVGAALSGPLLRSHVLRHLEGLRHGSRQTR